MARTFGALSFRRRRSSSRRRAHTVVPRAVRLTLASVFMAACAGDAPASREAAAPAIDSALARDLARARGDDPAFVAFGDTALGAGGTGETGGAQPSPRTTPSPDAAADAPRTPPPVRPRRDAAAATRPTSPAPTVATAPTREPSVAPPNGTPSELPTTPASTSAGDERIADDATGASAAAGDAPGTGRGPQILAAAGTTWGAVTARDVCTGDQGVGDRVVARLRAPWTAADGRTIPAGTPVLLEVARADSSGLAFRVKAVSLGEDILPASGTVRLDTTTLVTDRVTSNAKGKVVGGAIAGAVLGHILGKDVRSTVIGAAGGAAAGGAIAARNAGTRTCLPAGSVVALTLDTPLVVGLGSPTARP